MEVVIWAAEHIKDTSFPDKAIVLMDEAASKVNIENVNNKAEKDWPAVGLAEVQAVMREWRGNNEILKEVWGSNLICLKKPDSFKRI